MSYETENEGRGKLINRFVAEEAKRRGIEVRPLSYFIAELRGPKSQVKWFRANYPVMLCGFNPELVVEDEQTFRSCMRHAPEWMKLVDDGKYAELMADKTLYCPICCTTE